MLGQDTRSNLVDLADQLEHWVIGKLAKSKLALRDVARIGLTKDGVAIARNNLAGVQGGPEVILDGLVAEVVANALLHLSEPVEHFLVGPVGEKNTIISKRKLFKDGEFTPGAAYNPWRGPAKPLRPAARESMGELRALPTRWVVWALTFPPS